MSNSFFQFKQFIVHQEKCAMKVCTDACLFGAWLADYLNETKYNIKNALDIGSGTGLLSMMIAQQNNFAIDAIEINEEAYSQCKTNILNTPWSNSIHVTNLALQQFSPNKKYDLIFSNPPFYEADLKSDNSAKNEALHGTTLKLSELIDFIAFHLQESGIAAILITYSRWKALESLLNNNGFFVNKLTLVRQTSNHDYFRTMVIFSRNNSAIQTEELYITDENRNYCDGFKRLMKAYYLNL